MKGITMGLKTFSTLLGSSVAAVLLAGSAFAQAPLKIIAVYGDSFDKPESAQKFRHLWNSKGAVGKADHYEALTFVEKDRAYMKVGEDGKLIPGTPKAANWLCFPGHRAAKDKDKTARYLIGAYTMENDSTGNVWLVNGNLQNPYGKTKQDTVDLKVFINDLPRQDYTAIGSRVPTLFNANLGKLKKGDTLYLAVGPGEACDTGYFKLYCTLAEIPEGTEPPPPQNIIFPPADTAHPKMSADGNPQPAYLNTLNAHNRALLLNRPEIVFIGDSITAGWNQKVMKEKFAGHTTLQIGIGGDWTQNVLWRVENSTLDQARPKLIILLIGTNNHGNGYGIGDVVAGIAAIIKAVNRKTPATKVLLLGIFPRGKTMSEPGNLTIKQINAKLPALADNQKVFFLDIGSKLVGPDGTLGKDVFYDGLHLGTEGYIRWADAILPTVDRLLALAGASP